jgi:SAM-dependent methyltransferase
VAASIHSISAREGYDLWAPSYDLTPNPVAEMDARHALRVLAPAPGERVLDAGCGTGRNLAAVITAGAGVVGIDFSPPMLALARRAGGPAHLALADLQGPLPFEDETFDAVLSSLTGEHIADLEVTFAEFARILKPAGRLVFSVTHPQLVCAGTAPSFDLDGVTYQPAAFKHSVQDYLDLVSAAAFGELAFGEFKGDARLVEQQPTAASYLGTPMLLLIAAVK